MTFITTTLRRLTLALVLASAPGARAEDIADGVTDALAVLASNNIPVEAAAARKAALLAVVRSADPGARLVTPEQARHRREEADGRDFAIGVRLSMTNGQPLVIGVESNSPAARAGLARGDVLTVVDETNWLDLVTLPQAVAAIRGHSNATLQVQWRNAASDTNSAAVQFDLLRTPAIECTERLPNGLLYVKLNGLFPGAGTAVADTLRSWSATNRSGVILDLRGAGGADADGVAKIAGLFAKPGERLYTLRDRRDQELRAVKADGGKPIGLPIMALVDRHTSGAAELLAAILNDSVKGAMLVGEPTAADPLVREYQPLPSGDLLYLATRQAVTADGSRYDGRFGVAPDVRVNETAETEYDAAPQADRRALLEEELHDYRLRTRIRGDAILRRAVDILLGLKALNIGADHGSEGAT